MKSTAFWARLAVVLWLALSLPLNTFATAPLNVVVSIGPLSEMVNSVGGKDVRVTVLLPGNTAPALYEPTSKALMQMRRADMFVGIGLLPFEVSHWGAFVSQNKAMQVLNLSDALGHYQLINDHHHHHHPDDNGQDAHLGVDPHVWMDPLLMKQFAQEFAKALIKSRPNLAKRVNAQLAQYEDHLDSIHEKIEAQLSRHQQRYFITYHPTYSYFAKRYKLVQRSLEHDGRPPTLAHMVNLERLASYKDIKIVIVENHYRSRLAKRFAKKIGTEIVVVDPLSTHYSRMVLRLANVISNPKFK